MTLPKISIVTASFNQGKFIERTIQSVLSQQYPNLEYIVIDGGSTDGSVDTIKKYSGQLEYWCSEPDRGQYDAINKGFAKSTGDIMAFLNTDDIYLPWTLNTVASVFCSHAELDWLTSLKPNMINEDGVMIASGTVPFISRKAFLQGCYVPGKKSSWGAVVQEGTFWRRGLWIKAGARIDDQYKLAADFDLWCRFMEHTEPFGLGYSLAAMTRHFTQRSNAIGNYAEECDRALRSLHHRMGHKSYPGALILKMVNMARKNRLAWALARRSLRYECMTITPDFSTDDFSLRWQARKQLVY